MIFSISRGRLTLGETLDILIFYDWKVFCTDLNASFRAWYRHGCKMAPPDTILNSRKTLNY